MEKLAAQINSVPYIQYLSQQTHIAPLYIAAALAALAFIVIQKTPMGPAISNAMLAVLTLREVMSSLRSMAPRPADMRKHVIVLSLFVLLFIAESIGLGRCIPLFNIGKLALVMWAAASPDNAEQVYSSVFSKIPAEYLEMGNRIEQAARAAARSTASAVKSSSKMSEDEKSSKAESAKDK
ncbi:receptor expression-enhancing protein 5/6 [Pancytospora philotis]|nr:receptor expression-enhancing protein 5/6 [Pancytospora philotis]